TLFNFDLNFLTQIHSIEKCWRVKCRHVSISIIKLIIIHKDFRIERISYHVKTGYLTVKGFKQCFLSLRKIDRIQQFSGTYFYRFFPFQNDTLQLLRDTLIWLTNISLRKFYNRIRKIN